MKYTQKSIVFNEIPNETTLCYSISGCQNYCKGCHSSELWEEKENHFLLNKQNLKKDLETYGSMITAICFLGGDWHMEELISFLKLIKKDKFILKIGLYTAKNNLEELPTELLSNLDFIKIGEYVEDLGGLNSANTNQRFIDLHTGKNLNHFFIK